MKKATLVIQVLMGLIFLIFGLNGLLHFLPMPPMEGPSGEFVGLLITSRLIYIVKIMEIVCGIFLLSRRFVPLALLLLAPIVFNIFWFHITLAPEGAPMGIAILAMEIFLIWRNKKLFLPFLKAK